MTNEEARQWFLKVYSEIKGKGYVDENEEAYELAIKALEQEPKTGHWIKIVVNGQHKIRCDKCNYIEPEYATHIRNYCPNCGAKMVEPRGSEET